MKTKSKWSGAVFVMLALVLVAGLALVAAPKAPPAAAGSLAWTTVEGDFPLHGLPPGVGQIIDIDVYGNTVFVLADNGTAGQIEVYRSDDGGYRWGAPRVIAGAGIDNGVAIRISPNYPTDGAVMVLGNDGVVYTSTDRGVTWPFATAPVGVAVNCLAVSPTFNALQLGGQIVVGGAWDGFTACTWYETWQGPTVGWTGAWTGIAAFAPCNCLAVEYAPTSSLHLVAVMDDAVNTYGITGTIAGPWPMLAVANPPLCAVIHADVATGAVIALPDDYSPIATAACPNCPMYFFVGTWGSILWNSSTFWFDPTVAAWVDLKAGSPLPLAHYATSGLVADGAYMSATLIAGCYNFPITYHYDVTSWIWSAPVFIEGDGGPIGTASGTVGVLLAYAGTGNTVYAATTDLVSPWGFTPGDLCCLSRSDDFAASWSDTCLTSENFVVNVNDMVWLDNQTGIVVCQDISVWPGPYESTFKTWDKGFSWKRVDRWQDVTAVAQAPDGTIALLDTGPTDKKVLVSTDNGETFTPTAADPTTPVTKQMSAIAAGSAADIFVGDITGHIYVTHDGGATWTDMGALGARIWSMEVPDNYAAAPYVAAGMTSSTGVMEVLVSRDAGATWAQWGNGSTQDEGWGAGTGYIGMKFSPTFDGAADSLIYVHTVGAAWNDVYRGDLSDPTQTWQRTGCNPAGLQMFGIPAIDLVNIPGLDGINGITGNAIYVCMGTIQGLPFNGGDVRGTWRPEAVSAMEPYINLWRVDSIAVGLGVNPFAVIADSAGPPPFPASFWGRMGVLEAVHSDAGVDMFTVDTSGFWAGTDRVRNWLDTPAFLTPPVPTWPADGEVVPRNSTQPILLQWLPVTGASSYDVIVACDPTMTTRLVFVDSLGVVRSPGRTAAMQTAMSIPVGTLTDGDTYYWRVRVAQHGGTVSGINDHQGPWCETHSFTVAASSICYSPLSFTFNAIEGGANPPSQTLSIWNCGAGILEWFVSGDAEWLTLSPMHGASAGETDEVTVSVDISEMSAGEYDATITIESPGATNTPQDVAVSLIIGVMPGDADGDGDVDVFDLVKVKRIILGLDPPTPGADANQDGDVDVFDLVKVKRIILGIDA